MMDSVLSFVTLSEAKELEGVGFALPSISKSSPSGSE
jgi:hypothetical protein